MSLMTVGSLVGAVNNAKDLNGLASTYFCNFRQYANGVNGVTLPNEPFVVVPVAVSGSADAPRLTFAIIWSETTTWQVPDYIDTDSEAFDEAWGADNVCGFHLESEEHKRELRLTVDAAHLLMSKANQVRAMKQLKAEDEAKAKERERLWKIEQLQKQIAALLQVSPNAPN